MCFETEFVAMAFSDGAQGMHTLRYYLNADSVSRKKHYIRPHIQAYISLQL
jgi:hypothetical protein